MYPKAKSLRFVKGQGKNKKRIMVHACSITRREEKRLGSIPRSNEQTSNVLQIKKRLQSHI